ncbi:unnamed protein product, partial [Pylaiella littoralis]
MMFGDPRWQSSTFGAEILSPRPPPAAAAEAAAEISAKEPVAREWITPKVITKKKNKCDFCVKRKRPCDGLGFKHCSFCIAKNRPECRYSHRLPTPSRVATTKTFTRSTDMGENVAHASQLPPPQLSDQRSWHADGANAIQGERHHTATGPLPLPLKRGQFSASPATGLIGLQENGFLSDFFDCLGFLSLASESGVRTAIFSVMHAAEPEEFGATTSPPLHVAEGAIQCLVDGGNLSGGHWDQAVPAGGGPLLHDSSTCLLWCAVGLGALVRGCPLTHVEGYVDLAQVSLTHCFDGITLDSARAYLAMAVLHDFLGNQTKSHGYLESATSIVRVLPPERLPT